MAKGLARSEIVSWMVRLGAVAAISAPICSDGGSRLTNLSVLASTGVDAVPLTAGFCIGGSASKSVLVRGIGPSLAAFGISQPVTDPRVQLFADTTPIAQNDNWGGSSAISAAFSSVGAFPLDPNSLDAALITSLQPGRYSVQLIAASGRGDALVECYDLDGDAPGGTFTNLSALSLAGSGSNVLTIGFTISGDFTKRVLVRGIGPTLSNFGVPGVLPATQLRLFDSSSAEIGHNVAWTPSSTPHELFGSLGAFDLPGGSADSVLFVGLPSGTYTAQLSGLGTAAGTALVEVYACDDTSFPIVTLAPVTNPPAAMPYDPGAGTPSPGPDTKPLVQSQGAPYYPADLRRASLTGSVLVDFYVRADGYVASPVAIKATDYRFAYSAIIAVQTWTFLPARKNGRLETFHYQVPIIFSLD